MSSAVIEEIEDLDINDKGKEPVKEEQKLINKTMIIRKERGVVIPGLDIDKILGEYINDGHSEPLFLAPLYISDSVHMELDKGEPAYGPNSVITMSVVMTKSVFKTQFPTLTRYTNWEKAFKDVLADKKETFERLKISKHIPLYAPDTTIHFTKHIVDICVADQFSLAFGPLGKRAA